MLLVLFWPRNEECVDDGCALAFAAAVNWPLVLGVLVGAVVAFLVYVVSKSTGDPGEMDVS